MDKEFAVMCIPLISMGLRCAECAGCTHTFRGSRLKGWAVRGNFISILNIDIFNYVILMDSI